MKSSLLGFALLLGCGRPPVHADDAAVDAAIDAASCTLFGASQLVADTGGVAIGRADFDNNGTLDLVIGSGTAIKVYLGHGDGTFNVKTTTIPTSLQDPAAFAVGHFDVDAFLDLAVIDGQSNTAMILVGNGDGTFQAPTTYPTDSLPFDAVAEDFNHDGKTDLVVDNYPSPSTVSVMLGNGDGTLQPKFDYASGMGDDSMASSDLNGDGNPDLVLTSATAVGEMHVLLGNADGSFQPHIDYPAHPFDLEHSIAIADFNLDGNADLADDSSVFLGNGDGTFQPKTDVTAGGGSCVVAADFNHDGRPDLAWCANNPSAGTVRVSLGNGDGSFQPSVDYPVLGINNSLPILVAGDFDNDGKTDLGVMTAKVSVLLGACEP